MKFFYKKFNFSEKKGFTLLEALIVITILTLLTSFVLNSNKKATQNILLLQEKNHLISDLLRVKNLSISTFLDTSDNNLNVCGYGLHLDKKSFFIFKDLSYDCNTSDYKYSGDSSGEKVINSLVNLNTNFEFDNININDIFFLPPIPKCLIDGANNSSDISFDIKDKNNTDSFTTINLNNACQIIN